MRRLLAIVATIASTVSVAQDLEFPVRPIAMTSNGQLAQDVGIETLGGVFTPLLKRGCTLPCAITQTFSTADDNQPEIKLFLFRGDARLTKDAQRVGAMVIRGVPLQPRGVPAIEVTFVASENGVKISALNRTTGRSLGVARREF